MFNINKQIHFVLSFALKCVDLLSLCKNNDIWVQVIAFQNAWLNKQNYTMEGRMYHIGYLIKNHF